MKKAEAISVGVSPAVHRCPDRSHRRSPRGCELPAEGFVLRAFAASLAQTDTATLPSLWADLQRLQVLV